MSADQIPPPAAVSAALLPSAQSRRTDVGVPSMRVENFAPAVPVFWTASGSNVYQRWLTAAGSVHTPPRKARTPIARHWTFVEEPMEERENHRPVAPCAEWAEFVIPGGPVPTTIGRPPRRLPG